MDGETEDGGLVFCFTVRDYNIEIVSHWHFKSKAFEIHFKIAVIQKHKSSSGAKSQNNQSN